MKNNADIKFGDCLRKLREGKSLSQESLAEKTGLSRNYIGNIERGEYSVTVKNIVKLAKALETHPKKLFDWY